MGPPPGGETLPRGPTAVGAQRGQPLWNPRQGDTPLNPPDYGGFYSVVPFPTPPVFDASLRAGGWQLTNGLPSSFRGRRPDSKWQRLQSRQLVQSYVVKFRKGTKDRQARFPLAGFIAPVRAIGNVTFYSYKLRTEMMALS